MTGRLRLKSSSNHGRQTALIWGSRQSENETKLIVGSGEAIYDKIFLSKYDKVGSLYDNDSVGELVGTFSRKLSDSHKTQISWI